MENNQLQQEALEVQLLGLHTASGMGATSGSPEGNGVTADATFYPIGEENEVDYSDALPSNGCIDRFDNTVETAAAGESGAVCMLYGAQPNEVDDLKEATTALANQPADTDMEAEEIDRRSVYVGNVDYGATPHELQDHFKTCGAINRITIMVDRFTGHPKGYAYIEFADAEAVSNAVVLTDSLFRGRQIKVDPKRHNIPGYNGTGRGRGAAHRGRGGFGRGYRGRGMALYGPRFRGRPAKRTPY